MRLVRWLYDLSRPARPNELRWWVALFLLVGLLAAGVLAALANSPKHAPNIHSKQHAESAVESKGKTTDKAEGTKKPSAVVPKGVAAHLEEEGSHNTDKGSEDSSEFWTILGKRVKITDTLLALFTFFLVAVGAWQGMHLRRTVQSFVFGERPYVYPQPEPFPDLRRFGAGKPPTAVIPSPEIACGFANVGRTAAIIKEVRIAPHFGSALASTPQFGNAPIRKGEIVNRPDTTTGRMPLGLVSKFTKQDIDDIWSGKVVFFLFGYVKYADVFGALHTKGFGLRFRPGLGDYEVAGGAAYNYSRTERIPKELRS